MDHKRRPTVLIVGDQELNRAILKEILRADYDVVETRNSLEGLDALRDAHGGIAAVLLDIIMPIMDGYRFLCEIKKTEFASLPIIVMTGKTSHDYEQHALDLGAWDFIAKPFHPAILLSRLKNAIARSQMYLFEQLQFVAEHDTLTGLYNRSKFFTETRRMLDAHPENTFALIRFDVERFSLLNSFWGETDGDRFLQHMANWIRQSMHADPLCTFGRINADIFAICEPFEQNAFELQAAAAQKDLCAFKTDYFVEPTFGVYVISDPSLAVEKMYERAAIAAQLCKNHYGVSVGYYNQSMQDASMREQQIVNEMQHALDDKQFVVYLQPKYNLKTEQPYGAEALVRWIHPERGMISPGEFIPIFERNGFIGKLDYFVWDQVCALLRKWLDAGMNPAPVSVNISRANMSNPNIVDMICGLVHKHGISPSLLNLELTESAYMDNPIIMKKAVHKLQERGFQVMMDDFGSGYSSLNTLKDIPVDILKIDMNFLAADTGDGRSERILVSVIRMAGWLELPVIVEGVETLSQKEFLQSIGCGYVQGFFFARPMPVSNYEALISGVKQEPAIPTSTDNAQMLDTIWSADPHVGILLNCIQQPVAIYEFDGFDFFLLRVNNAFNDWFGYGCTAGRYNAVDVLPYDALPLLTAAFQRACATLGTAECEYERKNQAVRWLHITLKYMGENSNVKILFASFQDITERKQLEARLKALAVSDLNRQISDAVTCPTSGSR